MKNTLGFTYTDEANRILEEFRERPRWHSYNGKDEFTWRPKFLNDSRNVQSLKAISIRNRLNYTRDLFSIDGLMQRLYGNSLNPEDVTADLKRAGFIENFKDYIDFEALEQEARERLVEKKLSEISLPIRANKREVGGIDFNPNNLDLQTQGQEIEFDMPFDAQTILDAPIEGFAPVIIQIVPANIPLILGLESGEEREQLSSLQKYSYSF